MFIYIYKNTLKDRQIIYYSVLQIIGCPFVIFLLVIVLSVLVQSTDNDYSIGIFILFLLWFPQKVVWLQESNYLHWLME
jgi:hypothetical protein